MIEGAALRITEPCAERWEDMPAAGQGRFCDRCQHQVLDLSRVTAAQALAHVLLFGGAATCARMRVDAQGGGVFRVEPSRPATRLPLWVAASLSAACSSSPPVTGVAPAGSHEHESCAPTARIETLAEPVAVSPASSAVGPDRDQDGVSDAEDSCPEVPGVPAAMGCPEVRRVVIVSMGALTILKQPTFKVGAAKLEPVHREILDEVARLLLATPSIKQVVVLGHTDVSERSSLSLARASAVVDYLVKQGVDPNVLEARGAGSAKPIVVPDSPDARERNRRVEFQIVER